MENHRGAAADDDATINGHPAALALDRAVGELRRGRAILIADGERRLLAAAVETAPAKLCARIAGAGETVLLLTAERAFAAGYTRQLDGPIAIPFPPGTDLEALRAVAGVGLTSAAAQARFAVGARPHWPAGAAAALKLAKVAQLVPALIALETAASFPGVLEIGLTEIEAHDRFGDERLQLVSRARVPLADALECEIALFRDELGLSEHVAVLIGTPDVDGVVPVRLHSACLTGDLLGSLRCDCGEQLRTAVARIAELGGGVLLYLDQEGRGIGLPNKLRAYVLQDAGLDTVDADQHLGFLADERSYDVAAALLDKLGIKRIQLLTNNPQKISALREHGIEIVGRVPLVTSSNSHNERYLKAKAERAGHLAEEWGG